MLRVLFMLMFAVSSVSVMAQQFLNIKAKREDKKIVVSYDISTDKAGLTFDVKLECSADGGKTFAIFPQFVSGDTKEVSAGTGKKISWDVLREKQELAGNQLVFQLVGTVNQKVEPIQKKSIAVSTGSFTDTRDGHVYKWIKIGTQTWMLENLAYLPAVSPSREGAQAKPFYYVYGYNGLNTDDAKATGNFKTYGVLYNWSAAKTACPAGWHLPDDEDWKQLELALGMTPEQANSIGSRGAESGAKMKTTDGWNKSGNGTNASQFSALPAGGRYGDGNFGNAGSNGFWWSASAFDNSFAWGRGLGYDTSEVYKGVNYMESGFSVRCIKD
ncbi:MAG: hypothetical protein JZU47_06695 [Prolixibacteraceae bacterium]|nr:hypothetical protein [Prolixibacteraceae bacterium]